MRRSGSILQGVMAVEIASLTVRKPLRSSGLSSGVIAAYVRFRMRVSVLDAQTVSHTAKTVRLSLEKVVEYKCIYT